MMNQILLQMQLEWIFSGGFLCWCCIIVGWYYCFEDMEVKRA